MIYTLIVATSVHGGADYYLVQGDYSHLDFTDIGFDRIDFPEKMSVKRKELAGLLEGNYIKLYLPIKEIEALWSGGHEVKAITVTV